MLATLSAWFVAHDGAMARDDVPVSLTAARDGLAPRVLGTRRTWTDPEHPEENPVLTRPNGGPPIGVVWTAGGGEHVVAWADLARWATDSESVIRAALARDAPQARTTRLRSGTYRVAHPAFAPWVLLRPDLLDQFEVQGSPVLVIATTDELLITGSMDLSGLTTVADHAVAAVRRDPVEAVSAELWMRDDERWRTSPWPLPRPRWGRTSDVDLGATLRAEVTTSIGNAPQVKLKPPSDLAAFAKAVLPPRCCALH